MSEIEFTAPPKYPLNRNGIRLLENKPRRVYAGVFVGINRDGVGLRNQLIFRAVPVLESSRL
jgi:hypothetical protein